MGWLGQFRWPPQYSAKQGEGEEGNLHDPPGKVAVNYIVTRQQITAYKL